MNSAQRIIAKFGGPSALASRLNRRPSTVQYWGQAGTIPAKWHATLLALAGEMGVELYPGDFLTDDTTETAPDIAEIALPIAQWQGTLTVGAAEIPVYVLSDGRRVISRTAATSLLIGIKGGVLLSYLGVESLKGYLPDDLASQFIEFVIPGSGTNGNGLLAETFLEICTAYVRALEDGRLSTVRQREIGTKAAMFLASCAKIGLLALIDEATGYQYARAEDALQAKLKLFLEEEMRKWEATFPEELWKEFGRLTNWKGTIHQRPKYWGRIVMELIYEYLDLDVAEWLKKNNPKPRKGQNHHQWLSSQYGLRKLTEHIWMVIGLARACQTLYELKVRMADIYGKQPMLLPIFLSPPNVATHAPKPRLAPVSSPNENAEIAPGQIQLRLN